MSSGWRVHHIGLEGDDVAISGVRLWGQAWRPVSDLAVDLPHPTYPNQIHDFRIYEVGEGAFTLRFAFTELSNGVYGFYVPA